MNGKLQPCVQGWIWVEKEAECQRVNACLLAPLTASVSCKVSEHHSFGHFTVSGKSSLAEFDGAWKIYSKCLLF